MITGRSRRPAPCERILKSKKSGAPLFDSAPIAHPIPILARVQYCVYLHDRQTEVLTRMQAHQLKKTPQLCPLRAWTQRLSQ